MPSRETSVIRSSIGVVGPDDLVEAVKSLAEREFPQLRPISLSYTSEAQAQEIVLGHPEVDAWLFTGVIPYTMVFHLLDRSRPSTYIPYTDTTLYGTLVELLSEGKEVRHITIDTLSAQLVKEAFSYVGLPTKGVQVKEYRLGLSTAEFTQFHLKAFETHRSQLAITCARSVYNQLDGKIPIVRLVPAIASIRSALETILLELSKQIASDAQITLGLIELEHPEPKLSSHTAELASSIFPLGDCVYLLVTTRGLLQQYTLGFTRMPLLEKITDQRYVRMGFGIGRSAAEAEALSRRALERCRKMSSRSSVVCFGWEREFVLSPREFDHMQMAHLPTLLLASKRSGLSRATIGKLSELAQATGNRLTASDVAHYLNVENRSARRTLKQLERSALAVPIGTLSTGLAGRPSIVYELRIEAGTNN